MKQVTAFLKNEYQKFLALSKTGRMLLVSYLVFVMAQPLLGVFVQSYFWRETHEPLKIVTYYVGYFALLPIGFALNGKLLATFSSIRLYWLGCTLQGLVPFFVILSHATSFSHILLLGSIYGVAGGFFWSNNNLLSLLATTCHDRLYYNSLSSFTGTLVAIVIPVLTGWLLVLGEKTGFYLTSDAYRVMSLCGLLLSVIAGWIPQRITFTTKSVKDLFLVTPSSRWQKLRLLDVIHGFYNSVESFLPVLVMLFLVGNEATLGTTQSIAELCSALLIYYTGSFLSKKYRLVLLGAWVVGILIASGTLAFLFTPIAVLIAFALLALTSDFRWVALTPIIYDVIDEEEHRTNQSHYAYLLDREIFLDLGRLMGLALFAGLFLIVPLFAIRSTLFIGACLQIFVYLLAKNLVQLPTASK